MELCTCRAVSNLSKPRLFAPLPRSHDRVHWINKASRFGFTPGVLQYSNSSIRLAKSDESSSFTSQYVKDEPDSIETTDDSKSGEQTSAYVSLHNEASEQEDNYDTATENEKSEDNPLSEFQGKLSEFFDQLDIEIDSENLSSLFIFGGGGGVALWLTSAVVGAIDSIPLFPKLMEVVGIGYTLWFTNRYLLLKKNREELASKIEEIKKQVLGSDRS
nr:protein CURVATURE THYLAKOID 1D, chloroplastic [Ipomoea batatas]GMD36678.1 protein CURVATURE THYLAKOID 1D, chloroplastic [Ipomoea batatas]GME09958.1 protein CURVATURE THYLAKOID 1D, chloroplastic [Ipomoea batatas]